jgi:hypothetical protein
VTSIWLASFEGLWVNVALQPPGEYAIRRGPLRRRIHVSFCSSRTQRRRVNLTILPSLF